MAFKKYKLIAIDTQDNVITTADLDAIALARKTARAWLKYSNVGSVRVWRNVRYHVELVEVYVCNNGKYAVVKDGQVRTIRI